MTDDSGTTAANTATPDGAAPAPGHGAEAETPRRAPAWKRLTWTHRLAILGTLGVIVGLTLPCLPPGLCFGDAGDLQVASATLGITHPPGYVGYVSLGYLLTRIPGADPAYVVSLACWAAGLAALALGVLLQVRLGASPWIAAALPLVLLHQSRVWTNLVKPEVYAPSLALLAGTVYLLIRYAQLGKRRDLWLSTFLYGVLAVNRPPVLFAAPFLLLAWLLAHRGLARRQMASRGTFGVALALTLLPAVYSLGYICVRDTPQTPHNSIEQFTPMETVLPGPHGLGPRLERAWWLLRGAQFRSLMGNDWNGVRERLAWLYQDLEPYSRVTLAVTVALALLGAGLATWRCPVSLVILGGVALADVGFIAFYRVVGQAADSLPLLWVATVLTGVGLSLFFPHRAGWKREVIAAATWALLAALTITEFRPRLGVPIGRDATAYLAELDLATFPPDAGIVVDDWDARLPLCYARAVQTHRWDIALVSPQEWARAGGNWAERPVYFASQTVVPDDAQLVPFRNVWKLEPRTEPEAEP
jgi:hypothetical protein